MDRRLFLGAAGTGLAATMLTRGATPARADAPAVAQPGLPGRPPNIIFLFSDDVGIGDIGCYGGSFKTPRIDAMAAAGTRFERCYSTPLCGPSRCQTLTGRYPFRTGLISNQSANAVSPEREVMLPTVMKKAGYVTGSVGKWGQICLGPKEWGFDEWLVFKGSGRYWASQKISYDVNGQTKELGEKEYLPDLMHDFAVDFVRKHKDKPFCLYYPMSHIHGPILPTPDSKAGASPEQLYADNISYMDKLVGKLLDEVKRLGLSETTLVVFTGDNGTAHFGPATVNGTPLSGKKASMLEGGSRVPLIAQWPGTTPAGATNDDLIDFSDFLGTFAELGGAKLPDGVTIDSQSFAGPLRGQAGKPREWVYVELSGRSYAADKQYKLTGQGALFDLSKAPFQEIAVPAGTENAAAKAARAKLQAVLDAHPAKTVDAKTRAAIDQQRQKRQQGAGGAGQGRAAGAGKGKGKGKAKQQ